MQVFVSYARQDRAVVDSIVADLERLGHKAWYDDDLSGSQSWWEEIIRQIQACDVLIFALSRRSAQSEACTLEARYAADLGRAILPLKIEQGVLLRLLPAFVAERQLVEYTSRDVDAIIALTRAMWTVPTAVPLPDPLPDPPPVPFSYLTDLAARIASPEPITAEDQRKAVTELRGRITDEYQRDDVVGLMRVLRRRADLLAVIAQDIDQALSIAREQGTAPDPEPATVEPEKLATAPPAPSIPTGPPHGPSWTGSSTGPTMAARRGGRHRRARRRERHRAHRVGPRRRCRGDDDHATDRPRHRRADC